MYFNKTEFIKLYLLTFFLLKSTTIDSLSRTKLIFDFPLFFFEKELLGGKKNPSFFTTHSTEKF